MDIFLAGIIQGSNIEAEIHSQDWREPIRKLLSRYVPQANIYCHYSRHPESITYDLPDICATLEEGLNRARTCQVLVAYLPGASMGTAIEMCEAARGGAVVLTITPMAANWIVRAYSDLIFADLEAFERFLASGELTTMVERRQSVRPEHG